MLCVSERKVDRIKKKFVLEGLDLTLNRQPLKLNQRYGRGTVFVASAGLAGDRRSWTMKQKRRTQGYTTCCADLPVARA